MVKEIVTKFYFTFAGVGMACLMTSAYITAEHTFNESKGKALGLISLGLSLGISVMAPLINVLFDYYGYFGAMLILSAVLANSFLVPFLLQENRTSLDKNLSLIGNKSYGSIEKGAKSQMKSECKRKQHNSDISYCSGKRSRIDSLSNAVAHSTKLLLDLKFFHYCLLLFMISLSHSVFYTFLPGFATESGFSSEQATLLITVTGKC